MNMLDMRTVMISYVISNSICLAVMVILWRQNRIKSKELGFWLADYIMQFTAVLLITLRGFLPNFVFMVVGNSLVIGGTILLFIGLERYLGRVSSQYHNIFLLIIFIIVQWYFVFVQPSLMIRNINISVSLFLICFQCAWLLLHRAEQGMRANTRNVGLIFGAYCLFSITRIFIELTVPQSEDFFKSGLFDTLVILVFQMLFIGLTFTLFLMVNRLLFIDLENDIIQRKQTEESLKISEDKFSKAFQNNPDAIVISSVLDGKIFEVNESFFRITGYSKDETLDKTTIELNLWGKMQDRKTFIKKLQKSGRVQYFETTFRKKSGELLTGLISGDIINLKGIKSVITVIQDITERKEAEKEILGNNERLQALTEILWRKSETTQDLLDYALEQSLYLTKSKLGYIYFYDEEKQEFTLNTWSREVMQECSVRDPQTVYQLDKTGIWGEAVRQRQPIVLNDFHAPNPLKKGYPEGHAPLKKFMTVPIFNNKKIVTVVGMANKLDDYNDTDVLQLTLLMGSVWNIVELRLAEEALRDSEAELQALFASMNDLVIIYNKEGRYLKIATTESKLLINLSENLIGKTLHEVFPKEEADRFINHIKTVLETQRTLQIEYYLEIDHDIVWLNASVSPLQEDTVLWVARDITDRKLTEEESRHIGTHDILTRLYNRTFYEEELIRLEKSRLFPISVFMIDMDDLKIINDTQGHAAGDQLLQRTAMILLESFRPEDMVARIGGDEFAVILPKTNEEAAQTALNRVQHFLELSNEKINNSDLKISIGVATCNAQGSLSQALKKADDLMYLNKQSKKLMTPQDSEKDLKKPPAK